MQCRARSVFLSILVGAFLVAPSADGAEPAATLIDRMAERLVAVDGGSPARFSLRGSGFVTDSTHPRRPGDSYRAELAIRIAVDSFRGDAVLEFESGDAGERVTDRYFVRRGRPFQVDEKMAETTASWLGDLSPATIAALNPSIVAGALLAKRENAQLLTDRPPRRKRAASILVFAWNDELWRAHVDGRTGQIERLERSVYHDVFGDGVEEIRFEDYRPAGAIVVPRRVVVTSFGREIGRLDITAAEAGTGVVDLPKEKEDSRFRIVAPEDVVFRDAAPHLFTIDLEATNSRITVAEFGEYVVVIEGAYHSRNCDVIVRKVKERFRKPIRYFSFSHLHGQYLGGVRSYVHEGATVIVPPTTAPLIATVAASRHDLRPDAQSRDPKPARVEVVKDKTTIADGVNALEVFSVESGHTDEYLIFYFPRQRVLITGDLLCYRGVDQPLRERSRLLCKTIEKLGIDVETMYVSWPLAGYGCQNVVRYADFRAACAK